MACILSDDLTGSQPAMHVSTSHTLNCIVVGPHGQKKTTVVEVRFKCLYVLAASLNQLIS